MENLYIWLQKSNIKSNLAKTEAKTIDDLFNLAFDNSYLYELDLHLREKAIEKFSQISVKNLKLFYNLDNRIIYNHTIPSGNTYRILKKYEQQKCQTMFGFFIGKTTL